MVSWEWEAKKGGIIKRHKETLGPNRYVQYFDGGDGFTDKFVNRAPLYLCDTSIMLRGNLTEKKTGYSNL